MLESASGGVWSRGGLVPGGVCSGGGSAPRGGGIPACTEADPPSVNRINDRQVLKYILGHNFVAAGKNLFLLQINHVKNCVQHFVLTRYLH